MQQDPSVPTTGSAASSGIVTNRLFIGLGVGALAIAGAVGLALWWGGQPKIKRKRVAKKAGAAAGASGAVKAGGKKRMVRVDEAKIPLEKAAKMTIDEIQNALEQAEREGDKASQINIFFLLASSLLQNEQLDKQQLEAAIQYYNIALQYAEEINSELLGPILLELAVLSYNFKNYPQSMTLFEQGLKTFLETPEEEVEATNTKHVLMLFGMLGECYLITKQHQRGIDFLLDYLKRAEGRKEHAELFPSLMLSVGEFTYALKDYPACINHLEQGLAKAEGTDLPPDLVMMYNYYLAWANVKSEHNEQAVKYLERYLDAAKVAKVGVENTLESLMSLVICYKELGQIDLAVKTVDRALHALKQIDEAEHPLLCLKQFYFLGLYCLNKLEQLDRARDLLERAYQLAKSNTSLSRDTPWGTIAIDLAEAYHKLKMRQEALKMIDTGLTALRERDTSLVPPALIRQAKIYSEMGDKATAVSALEEALKFAEELRKKESATAGAAGESELGSGWLCRFLKFQLGKMYTLMGQLSKADALLTEAFNSFVGTTDLEIRTVVLATIASNLVQAGQKEEGLKKIQEVIDVLATPTTQKLNQGDIRTELGECYLFLGDYAKAKQELEGALEQFAKEKNEKSELLVLVRLAAIHDWLGEVDRALECLALADKAKDKDSSVIHLGSVGAGYALHYLAVGDIAKAQAQADQAANYVDAACCGGTPLNVLALNGLLAETNFWSNRMEASIQHFQRCLQHISTFPYAKENIVTILNVQTRLLALSLFTENKGQDANALAMLDQLLPLARAKGGLHHVAQLLALTGLAKARALDDAEADATALFAEALSVADETADRRVLAFVNRLAGSFYTRHATGKADEGRKCLDLALALARQLGDQLLEAAVLRDQAIVAVGEQTSDEDKERTWREATAGALEIAERTGNKYLASLLAHLPGQAPAAPSLVVEPVEAAKVEEEEAKPQVVAEEAIPVQTEEEVKPSEETKTYAEVVEEANAEEAAKVEEEAAAPEQQESRTEEETDTKTYAEVLQEANAEEEAAKVEEAKASEETETDTKSYAEVVQEANAEEKQEEADQAEANTEEKQEAATEEAKTSEETETDTKSYAEIVQEANVEEAKVTIEDVAEDEHDE